MSIVDGTGLIVWEGGLFEPDSDLLKRTQWAFGRIRDDGGTIHLNEAGRPFGVESDKYARREQDTASGRSTVWYQWGRFLRGETPSAADPRSGNVFASEHTQGKATDTNAPTDRDAELRRVYFGMVGMFRTIASESWHFAIRRDPEAGVSLASFGATTIQNGSEAAQPEEDYNMTQGAFYRLKDDQPAIGSIGPGSIFYQEKPHTPLLPLQDEWLGYSANKNQFADLTNQQLTGIINTCGIFKTGAHNRLIPAEKGVASFDGFSVWLP